ncbi:MAG: LysM peptidoglycan-binding domain-containing protein [Lachnospiraceae bacterium]
MKANYYRYSLERNQYSTYSTKRLPSKTKRRTRSIVPVEFRISVFLVLFFVIMILFGNLYSIGAHNSTVAAPTEKHYTCIEVISGDTLTDIALEYQSAEYSKTSDLIDEICYINHLNDTDSIFVGQNLVIPYYK